MNKKSDKITNPDNLDPEESDSSQSDTINPRTDTKKLKKPIRRWIILVSIMMLAIIVASTVAIFLQKHNTNSAPTSLKKASSNLTNDKIIDSARIPDAINPINPKKIPLGDDNVSTSSPKIGSVYSCQSVSGGGGGNDTGPWLNKTSATWDSTIKVSVSGAVAWPSANYQASISGNNRNIVGNDLPLNGQTTGVYPIQKSDKAYIYDANPNKIATQTINLSLPIDPVAAAKPGCLNMGAVGILDDGVVLFNGLDGESRDAAAHETLDSCDGHPERSSEYHHHNIPSCILSKYKVPNTSTLVGYANDGYGIYIERDSKGNLLTNANLDECHGRTSTLSWNDKSLNIYHYVATLEYPYTLGCFHGTSTVKQSTSTANRQQGPPPPR